MNKPSIGKQFTTPKQSDSQGYALVDLDKTDQEQGVCDPVEIVSDFWLAAAIPDFAHLAHRAKSAGLVAILEVPSISWVSPMIASWGRLIMDTSNSRGYHAKRNKPFCLVVTERASGQKHDPDIDKEMARNLLLGGAVLGIAAEPDDALPQSIVQAADVRIKLPALSPKLVARAICKVKGTRVRNLGAINRADKLEPSDFLLTFRMGDSARDYARRLGSVAEARVKAPDLTLDVLAGMDAAVQWGKSLAADISDYKSGNISWSAVDRGMLLCGPAGVGKTTFARALAGSCGLPLIATSLAIWQSHGHLGDTLRAMRESFAAARAVAPVILFIDEMDSIGDREKFTDRNRDYSIQIVNALLEQLDGAQNRDGVVVIAATNHPSRIDKAILRSGRLDRSVWIPLPHCDALAKIFRFHLGADLKRADLVPLANLAAGASGADCERWVRGARRRARCEKRAVTLTDLELEVRGPVPTISKAQKWRHAVHEAGHTVAIALTAPCRLVRVTIRQVGNIGGGVAVNDLDTAIDDRSALDRQIMAILAGRAAEQIVLGSISAGSGGDERSDIARATHMAAMAVSALGLGRLERPVWRGMPELGDLQKCMRSDPSFAEEVGDIIEHCYAQATAFVKRHEDSVLAVARRLEAVETIEGADALLLIGDVIAERSTVSSIEAGGPCPEIEERNSLD